MGIPCVFLLVVFVHVEQKCACSVRLYASFPKDSVAYGQSSPWFRGGTRPYGKKIRLQGGCGDVVTNTRCTGARRI
jgi:hypothetical protein